MLSVLILAASLAGQSADAVKAKSPPPEIPKATRKPASPSGEKAAERARLLERRKAKVIAKAKSSARKAEAFSRSQAELEAQYLKMLPYIQAQERINLEHQRQLLSRMTDIERNAALNRMVSAMEKQAGYSYPGQSPVVGPYATTPGPIVAPVDPLYSRLIP
jgi:hypothetical protein